jgi:hypothetical protein
MDEEMSEEEIEAHRAALVALGEPASSREVALAKARAGHARSPNRPPVLPNEYLGDEELPDNTKRRGPRLANG